MKAILTKYLGPTNTKPSRVKAYDTDNNSVTVSFSYPGCDSANDYENHKRAAIHLCRKMKWSEDLIGGGIKDGYAFVFKEQ
jgi:hypothetical protein